MSPSTDSLDPDASSGALDVRLAARRGGFTGHTSGLASAYVQANLALRPTAAGARQRVGDYPNFVEEPTDVTRWWRDDLVAFVIGCSFSFEHALLAEGIPLRHVEQGRNVAMYRTSIETTPAGVFRGPTVVSMRPLTAADAIRAVQITSRLPQVHGAPLHLGDPSRIGIDDIARPDYGDAVDIRDGELPVFWACGVTPQSAIETARPPFCITHAPGHMLVTDLLNRDLIAA